MIDNGEMRYEAQELLPAEVPLWLGGEMYIISEASHDAVIRYRNALSRAGRMDDGKLSRFEGLADAEPLLVSLCVFKRNGDGTRGVSIAIDKIRALPHRIISQIFDKIKEISPGLTLKAESKGELLTQLALIQKKLKELEEPKNLPSATTESSV